MIQQQTHAIVLTNFPLILELNVFHAIYLSIGIAVISLVNNVVIMSIIMLLPKLVSLAHNLMFSIL